MGLAVVMLGLGAGLLAAAVLAMPKQAATRKGGTFRIALASLDAIDPATAYGAGLYLGPTCAKLFNFTDTRSGRFFPEVAARFPTVSRDGKTYTFTLRKSYRFNTGGRVTAASFAHELNRALSLKIWSSYFEDIVGAQAVMDGRASEASGIQARGYKLVIRLTAPVPDLTARLATSAACSVPPTLPIERGGVGAPLPAAGPYYIAEYLPGRRLVLKRNRFYRGPRPHHVDQFVVSFVDSEATALSMVKRGQANWADVSPDAIASGLTPRERKNKAQFFVRPGSGVRYLAMNTSQGLFKNNPKLRRAVNFVIDRSALVRQFGPLAGQPTDQYLPPSGAPGFRNAHIYPLKRPDLRRARALARGHLRGGHAVFYSTDSGWRIPQLQIIQQNLRNIGISIEIHQFPPELYFQNIWNLAEPYDLALLAWSPDYPDPYDVLNSLLSGQALRQPETFNVARFDSPKWNRLLHRAAGLSGRARYRAYGNLDIQLTRDASPLAAYMSDNVLTYVSKRTGCVIVNPSLDLAAVCLK